MAYIRNSGFRFIEGLEAEGRNTFTVEEAIKKLKVGRRNTLAILGTLRHSKRIITLTKGLYTLWHPSERKWGLHPLPIIDVLMKYRKTPYYIGLLSAADHYGAAHHKPQRLQVIIPKQMKFRRSGELAISFHVFKKFPLEGASFIKTSTGKVNISSPEQTALDLFYFEAACGGFRNICLVIRDLLPKINADDLKKTIKTYPCSSSVQKLGYMLEYFNADKKLLNIVANWAKNNDLSNIALSFRLPKKGRVHPLWHIIENAGIEEEE